MGSGLSIDLLAPSVVAVLENNDYITSRESLWITKETPTQQRYAMRIDTSEVNACKNGPFLILIADSVLQHLPSRGIETLILSVA